ncbi:MAG: depolymerase esterase [Massilia sp.]|jgi:poly(hydroxyalkanoate) depolymerase family esterase|nr:depolymerase esterase [Massilia sp.]
MVKTSNPFLRSLMRAGKKQQRSVARAIGSLLAPPKPKAKAKARPTLKPKPAKVAATVAPLKSKPARAVVAAPLKGKWLASHYAGSGDGNPLHLRRLSYWLYLPDRPPAETMAETVANPGLPLIVMLHGCDQTATSFAEGTRMNALAEIAGCAVVYPQQALSTHPHRCWKWYDRATQQGGGDVPLIVGIIHKVSAAYPIDRSRIYICGISAGAGMANIVALNHPELFAALGLHSGPIFGAGHSTIGALAVMQHGAGARVDGAIEEVLDKREAGSASVFSPLPTILIQGEDDHVVRPINQVQLARQAMLVNRLPVDSVEKLAQKPGTTRRHGYQLRDVYRGRKVMLRVARIAELKHAWSGGDGKVAFNSGRGPEASKMMLDFFSRHRRAA